MSYGLFQVTGVFAFRGHQVGETFEAKVTPQIARAVKRGTVVCLELFTPRVPDGYRLPKGWLRQ